MPLCPKCGFTVGEGFAECPACGVILAKVRATAPRLPPDLPPDLPPGLPPGLPMDLPPALPPPPPPEPVSPYAPPATALREPAATLYAGPVSSTPAGTGEEISPRTLEALVAVQPWLRFLVIYGFVMLAFMALGAVGSCFAAARNPRLMPIAVVYGFYAAIGLVFLLPLNRSVEAIRRLAQNGSRRTLESFIVEQGTFWRRTGWLTAIMLCLAVVGVVLAILLGGLAAMARFR